jgi:hypothetical protein
MATKKHAKPIKKAKKLGNVKPLSLRQTTTLSKINPLTVKSFV